MSTRRADFDYGNTRLRARKGGLLTNAGYERLVGADLDGVLGALADTPDPPAGATAGGAGGHQRLDRAIRARLAGTWRV